MTTRTLFLPLLIAAAVAASLVSAPASAAPDTIYCLNGVSTTLPASVSASSATAGGSSVQVTEAYALDAISLGGGVFYYGYVPGGSFVPGWYLSRAPGVPVPTSEFEAGWTAHSVSLGQCTERPGVTHVGVCKVLMRADGTVGRFQEVPVADWNDPDGPYFDAPAANWIEGVGLTCDDPVALGYRAAGYSVAWGGAPDPGHDPTGARASGFNNIYPYFIK